MRWNMSNDILISYPFTLVDWKLSYRKLIFQPPWKILTYHRIILLCIPLYILNIFIRCLFLRLSLIKRNFWNYTEFSGMVGTCKSNVENVRSHDIFRKAKRVTEAHTTSKSKTNEQYLLEILNSWHGSVEKN